MAKKVLVLPAVDDSFLHNRDIFGDAIRYHELSKYEAAEIGLIIFGGGVDVDPKYYKEPMCNYTQSPHKERDAIEFDIAKWGIANKIPMIGSCRGAQLLTVVNGGKLIQHVTGHTGGNHEMYTRYDETLTTNSYHHQMMFPWTSRKDFQILAKASTKRSIHYLGGHNDSVFKQWGLPQEFVDSVFVEPEIIWWPDTLCLCVQGHPEWMPKNSPMNQYINEEMERLMVPHVSKTGCEASV